MSNSSTYIRSKAQQAVQPGLPPKHHRMARQQLFGAWEPPVAEHALSTKARRAVGQQPTPQGLRSFSATHVTDVLRQIR